MMFSDSVLAPHFATKLFEGYMHDDWDTLQGRRSKIRAVNLLQIGLTQKTEE